MSDDISVVGIDDSKFAALCDVGLTTVKYPQQRLGEAAETLLKLMKNSKSERDDVKFVREIVVRNSVHCIK